MTLKALAACALSGAVAFSAPSEAVAAGARALALPAGAPLGVALPASVPGLPGLAAGALPTALPLVSAPAALHPTQAAVPTALPSLPAVAQASRAAQISAPERKSPAAATASRPGALSWNGASAPQARILSRRFAELSAAFGDKRPLESPAAEDASGSAPALPPAAGSPESAQPAGPAPPPAPRRPRSDLPKRAATAAVLVPGLIAAVHAGGLVFGATALAIVAGMLWEYGGILQAGGRPVQRLVTLGAGLGLAAAVIAGAPLGLALAGAATAVALRELLRPEHSIERAAFSLAGAALLGVLPAYLAPLRALPHGQALALLALSAAWATDTLAYLVGRTFGRRKLAPVVSPKKTWEGAAGGLAGALAAGAAFAAAGALSWPAALAIAATIGTVGQASGLVSSMIKRANNVKDSGKLLPGHGGVLDRFDTFILSAPLVFALALLLA